MRFVFFIHPNNTNRVHNTAVEASNLVTLQEALKDSVKMATGLDLLVTQSLRYRNMPNP
jgi:hypothetical protein